MANFIALGYCSGIGYILLGYLPVNIMNKKIKYKLVDQNGYTRRGMSGKTYWLDKQEKVAIGDGTELCTDGVIHYYDDPYLAVLFNPIHADIDAPRLITIKIDKQYVHDGLKGGCKKAKYIKEIKLPKISIIQRVTFAIKVSLAFYKDEKFEKWAINWLNGSDRTWAAAEAARAAAGAAATAIGAAVRAAESAEAAAMAAIRVAESAEAAGAAAMAAEAAGAAEAAIAAKSNRFFIKTIKEIIKNG